MNLNVIRFVGKLKTALKPERLVEFKKVVKPTGKLELRVSRQLEQFKTLVGADIEKASFKSNPDVSNPFITQAETQANYAQTIITKNKPINEAEYSLFAYNITNIIGELDIKRTDRLNPLINPINESNIESVKTELFNLFKSCGNSSEQELESLRKEIFNCNDAGEMFNFIKGSRVSDSLNDEFSRKMTKLYDYAESKNISLENPTNELEDQFSEISANYEKKSNKLRDIFTPKSINSEVLEIEEQVRNLGVKYVNFSDDLEQAKLIKEVIEDLIKREIPLPHSITLTPLLEYGARGRSGNYLNNYERFRCIYLPVSEEAKSNREFDTEVLKIIQGMDEFKLAPPEYQERFMNQITDRIKYWFSTNNSKHIPYHEVGHTLNANTLKSYLRVLTNEEMETAGKLSIYSTETEDGAEYFAEEVAFLLDGGTIPHMRQKLFDSFDSEWNAA